MNTNDKITTKSNKYIFFTSIFESSNWLFFQCALLVISTILYGLDMRMNVTPSCEHLHPIVKLTYWEECNGFYNEFSFVCGQGIICAIVVSLTFINTPKHVN